MKAFSKISNLEQYLNNVCLGQPEIVRLTLIALILGEHIALVGKHGEGKTFVSERLCAATDLTKYYHLFTKYTTPDEVFGNYDIKKMLDGTLERKLDGKAAKAQLCIFDEVFKSNSALLNSLLGFMNERKFENVNTPLRTIVGISNEWPNMDEDSDEDSLLPLFDRFIIRKQVDKLSDDALLMEVILGQFEDEQDGIASMADFVELGKAVNVVFQKNFREKNANHLIQIKKILEKNGINVSTRRISKSAKLICANSVMNGRESIMLSDFSILQYCLWEKPEQQKDCELIINDYIKRNDPNQMINEIIKSYKIREGAISGKASSICHIAQMSIDRGAISQTTINEINNTSKEAINFFTETREQLYKLKQNSEVDCSIYEKWLEDSEIKSVIKRLSVMTQLTKGIQ